MIPLVLVGACLGGLRGAGFGFLIALMAVLVLSFLIELLAIKIQKASSVIPRGLDKSLEFSAVALHKDKSLNQTRLPRLFVFSDPLSYALVVKSLGGNGVLLLSQGLVTSSNEQELRKVLKTCLLELQQSGIVTESFFSIMGLGLFRLIPSPWVRFLQSGKPGLSPISLVGLWMFLSMMPLLLSFKRVFRDSRGLPCIGLVYLLRRR